MPKRPYYSGLFAEVDELLGQGACDEGRLEIESAGSTLICLVHHGKPYLAGLVEPDGFSDVRLGTLALRAGQLRDARATLIRSDASLVLMIGVHLYQKPMLEGSTRLVDPAHVLDVLRAEKHDAAIALERDGTRTLLFLHRGEPSYLHFGRPEDDPREGSLEERMLLYAFAPSAQPGVVSVYTDLKLPSDPDTGKPLAPSSDSAKLPPPMDVCVYLPDGRELRRRPFQAPAMVVGRDAGVDLFIDNLAVSRKHARLLWERGRLLVEDLESANGTRVNGKRVERQEIDVDDKISIGKFDIRFETYDAAPATSETLFVPLRPAVPPPGFLVGNGLQLSLERDRLIGKGRGADAAAKGWGVQGVHARVGFNDGEFTISCFGNARAKVNGRWVTQAKLSLGDEIVIGRSSFRIEPASEG